MPVLTDKQVAAAGNVLFAAERDRQQVGLMTASHPDMDMDDAYAIQSAFVNRKLEAGGSISGWKIGLTSKAMQYALNIDIPDSGILFEDMFFDHGSRVPAGRFIEPRIEAEIAFIMGHDLEGPMSRPPMLLRQRAQWRRRWKFWIRGFFVLIQTQVEPVPFWTQFQTMPPIRGIVMGDTTHAVDAFDLRWAGAIVARNDEVEETGLGAGVLNDPVLSMATTCTPPCSIWRRVEGRRCGAFREFYPAD